MEFVPSSPEAYDLFHQGTLALAQIEANGMRVDIEHLHASLSESESKIRELEKELRRDDVYKLWQRRKGSRINLDSSKQLADIIFGELGYEAKTFTDSTKDFEDESLRRPKADKMAFEHIELPFLKTYFERGKYLTAKKKLREIQREIVNGYLHPVFNLHTAITYRGSCELPNFQNIPVRVAEIAELIRSCFIPRDGHQIVEVDFSGIEVRIAYCYHKDPVMREYLLDPTKDMHRDMAAECYMLDQDTIDKEWWSQKGYGGGHDVRYCGKNKFIFPEFYGDYWFDCAQALWEAIDLMKLTTSDGVPLKKHLRKQGIKGLGDCDPKNQEDPQRGTFQRHIQKVEKHFWGKRFKVYDQWKRRWYDKYLERTWFEMKTGFRVKGKYKRNQVINSPVQGAAFHCLLWVLIKLQKWLKKNKMKTVIIGQIHDSIVADVHESEREEYLQKVKELATVSLLKHWKWIIIPLDVEAEVAAPGESWFKKEKVEL